MPNGADRDFVRFISCIRGFKAKFAAWRTKVRLDPSFIKELKEVMDIEDYNKLTQEIALIPDRSNPYDGVYIAEDDKGNASNAMHSAHITEEDVLEWLDIKWPDY